MWPVLLGRQGSSDVGSQSRDQEEWMMWLECALRSECESWSHDLSSGALLHSETRQMESRAWTPSWACWVGWGWDTCSSSSCVCAALCYSPVTLSSDVSAPVSLVQVNSVVILSLLGHLHDLVYDTQLHRRESKALEPLLLWGKKPFTSVHAAWFRDQVLCHPVYTEKMKRRSNSLSKSQIIKEHRWLVESQGWF